MRRKCSTAHHLSSVITSDLYKYSLLPAPQRIIFSVAWGFGESSHPLSQTGHLKRANATIIRRLYHEFHAILLDSFKFYYLVSPTNIITKVLLFYYINIILYDCVLYTVDRFIKDRGVTSFYIGKIRIDVSESG